MSSADRRLLDLFGVELPIVLAPMANFAGLDMAVAVAEAGGLGSLPCAVLSPDQIREDTATFRARTDRPLGLNFFCHAESPPDPERDAAWLARISLYFTELGVELPSLPLPAGHPPFGEAQCAAIEHVRPDIVSFHFGLPAPDLLARVKATGAIVIS
jgi:nitronate monooxygenase